MSKTFLGQTLLVLSLATLVLSQQYLITPNSQSFCQINTTCFTLDQLAQTNLTNGVNLTLIFQPGEHTLTRLLSIHNFTHVQMIGQNTPVLTLHDRGWLQLSDIDQLSIEGLNFTGHTHTSDDSILPLLHRLSISNTYSLAIKECSFTDIHVKTVINFPNSEGSIITLQNIVNVQIEDVVFDSNNGTALNISNSCKETDVQGVAIECGEVIITDSVFQGNSAPFGGGITVDSGNISLYDSTLSGNTATYGGVIFVYSGNTSLYDSTLSSNTATNNGGGIFVDSGNTSLYHSKLSGNTATFGGGIYVYSGNTSLYDSTVSGNTATYVGGGIYVVSGNTSLYDSTLSGNIATYGGGILVDSGNTSLYNSTLSGNTAISDGGGIFVYSGNTSLYDSTVCGNIASYGGGGIYVSLGNTFLYDSTLSSNIATYGGGILVNSGNTSLYDSALSGNTATSDGGGIFVNSGNTSLYDSTLSGNTATNGGGIYLVSGNTSLYNSTLSGNSATYAGGGILVYSGNTSLHDSALSGNTATYGGGIAVRSGNTSLYNSTLSGNTATYGGGIYVYLGNTSLYDSTLSGNTDTDNGGGILVDSGKTSLYDCTLSGNTATYGGGIVVDYGNTSLYDSTLSGNTATYAGGGIYVVSGNTSLYDSTLSGNTATYGGGIVVYSGNTSLYDSTLSGNTAEGGGVIYLFNSQAHFNGPTVMDNNYGTSGGAIEAVQSSVNFNNKLTINNNTAAEYGGGIFLKESSLFVNSPVTISHNTAKEGGAICAYQSIIEFNKAGHARNIMIANNVCTNNGGGIFLSGSSIKISSSFVHVDSNTAEHGGGLYLQQNSKLYIQKLHYEQDLTHINVNLTLSNNEALLSGGGMYINDSTSGGGACDSRGTETGFLRECFIQTIKLYSYELYFDNTVNTFITNNTADQSGSAIYGGLLDRCTVSPSAELVQITYPNDTLVYSSVKPNGLEYINRTVKMSAEEVSISSDPLQVKFCDNHARNVTARKGQPFRLNVKALDQVGNPVNATIHGAVVTKSGVGRLKEGQVEQIIGRECTELEYNVFSKDSSAQLELYAIGPCNNLGISRLLITVKFLNCTCPLGFHPSQSDIECNCECDPELQAAELCFPEEETFQPGSMLWVGAEMLTPCNDTGYLVHDCPFDYCVDQLVNISLNSSQQIDRQCAYNRSGVLCGECKEGLSLIFASSKCKECSDTYLLLLIPFAVAGIALVVFILWLNITIATGTIYGLIFYANVLAANKALFLPFRAPNFLTVFVSWVNLDLGIETCFYNGMNSQTKVLLQLAFPVYLFLLMFLIIVLSNYVNPVAKLLSNRNPVAALCTLLILSYSKLLRLIIAALQFTYLDCSNNSAIFWLYDGNVQYFSPSHIPRFVAAAIILTACVLFTTLLFFGQWFPRCSKWKVMKWTKNTKYIGFMDAFHAPFTPKHRYWPGLLLFVLITHNLVASMAPGTSVPVLSAGCLAVGLNMYKFLVNRVYKNRLNSALETLFLVNIVVLTLGTLTVKLERTNYRGQHALAYVSMVIAFILFVVITCYHFYKYVLKKTDVWNNQVRPLNPARRINIRRNRNYQRVAEIDDNDDVELPAVVGMCNYGQGPREETDPADKYITPPIIRPATRPDQLREPDLDILAPITEDDYRPATPTPQAENRPRPVVTCTVMEI